MKYTIEVEIDIRPSVKRIAKQQERILNMLCYGKQISILAKSSRDNIMKEIIEYRRKELVS